MIALSTGQPWGSILDHSSTFFHKKKPSTCNCISANFFFFFLSFFGVLFITKHSTQRAPGEIGHTYASGRPFVRARGEGERRISIAEAKRELKLLLNLWRNNNAGVGRPSQRALSL